MWIATQSGILSIVKDKSLPGNLLVRSRNKEALQDLHIKSLSGNLDNLSPIVETPNSDYPYRVSVSKRYFAAIISEEIIRIDYPNFKDSVGDDSYHDLLLELWITIKLWYASR